MVAGIDSMIVVIHNENVLVMQQIALIPISLMSIQIDDHHFLFGQPGPYVMNSQRDVRVHAKPASCLCGCVMVTS